MKSYSSEQTKWTFFFREARNLYAGHRHSATEHVSARIEEIRQVEANILNAFGLELCDKDVLEIGPGQFLTQLSYLAGKNRAVGIDLDVIAQGLDIRAYIRMLSSNGLRRTLKTVGRKMLGVDARYAQELVSQLDLEKCPKITVYQIDANAIQFSDGSFDFIYCRSVLHHVPVPARVLTEIARLLRPGGVAYLSIHLFTSETGSLDPRVFEAARQSEIYGWPHLRPQLQDTVRANAFLNRLRLGQWRNVIKQEMPSARLIMNGSTNDAQRVRDAALELKARGELAEYSMEELETFELVVVWQKP